MKSQLRTLRISRDYGQRMTTAYLAPIVYNQAATQLWDPAYRRMLRVYGPIWYQFRYQTLATCLPTRKQDL